MIRVFTDGVFDCLHANHVAFLRDAKTFGDFLVVGVIPDNVAASYKRVPIMTSEERLEVVSALAFVDEAFLIDVEPETGFDEAFLDRHRVDQVVYAGDALPHWYRAAVERGIMNRIPYRDGISTSEIIQRIKNRGL